MEQTFLRQVTSHMSIQSQMRRSRMNMPSIELQSPLQIRYVTESYPPINCKAPKAVPFRKRGVR